MTGVRMRPLVIKEIRALGPIWLAGVCAMIAAAAGGFRGDALGLTAYTFGAVALGAHAIGHEYAHHTLATILSQPSSRPRLFLIKLGALLLMLLTLTAVSWVTVRGPGQIDWVASSLLVSVCLAPLLAMACRTTVGGVVFVGALPFWISVLTENLGARVVWGVTLVVCAAGAFTTWRLFMRLEAIDGRGADLRVPDAWRRTSVTSASGHHARPRHPVWRLVKKELHLQQMTFAVAGVWIVIWLAIGASTWLVPAFAAFPLARAVGPLSILYGGLLAMLIGSLASAEERQMGTLEGQLLLPMAAWKQWAVKAATVLGLAGVLSFAIPVALAADRIGLNAYHAASILVLTTGSLYISSLSTTGLRALLVSGPVMLMLARLTGRVAGGLLLPSAAGNGARALLAAALAGVVALALWFALENHRSAGQSAGRVVWQVASIGGALGLGVVVALALR
jgi:hypothetical protein